MELGTWIKTGKSGQGILGKVASVKMISNIPIGVKTMP